MGPEGGAGGGTVVAQGTPEQVAANPPATPGATWRRCWRLECAAGLRAWLDCALTQTRTQPWR